MKTLHVRAAGAALVPDFEAMDQGVMRFVGRRFVENAGEVIDPRTGKPAPTHGWVPLEEPVTVPFRREYVDELRARALEPADAATAALAGVPFPASA